MDNSSNAMPYGSAVPMNTQWQDAESGEFGQKHEYEAPLLSHQEQPAFAPQTQPTYAYSAPGTYYSVPQSHAPPSNYVAQPQQPQPQYTQVQYQGRPMGIVRPRNACCSPCVCFTTIAVVITLIVVAVLSFSWFFNALAHGDGRCISGESDFLPNSKTLQFPVGTKTLNVFVDSPVLFLRLNVTEDAKATQIRALFRSNRWASQSSPTPVNGVASVVISGQNPDSGSPCVTAVLEIFVPPMSAAHLNITVLNTDFHIVAVKSVKLGALTVKGRIRPNLEYVTINNTMSVDCYSVDMGHVEVKGPIVVDQQGSFWPYLEGQFVSSGGLEQTRGTVRLDSYTAYGDVVSTGDSTWTNLGVGNPAEGVKVSLEGSDSTINVNLASTFQGSYNATSNSVVYFNGAVVYVNRNSSTAPAVGTLYGGGNSTLLIRDNGSVDRVGVVSITTNN